MAYTLPMTFDECKLFKTHKQGLSSYTWYQNVARKLILEAGSGFTTPSPELHPNQMIPGVNILFKHFHNYKKGLDGRLRKYKDNVAERNFSKVHSFFGLGYWKPSSSSDFEIHPGNPDPTLFK